MSETIKFNKIIEIPQEIHISDRKVYVENKENVVAEAKKQGLVIYNLPQIINAMKNNQVKKAIRAFWVDADSTEHQGTYKKDKIYAVGHSLGAWSNLNFLKENWSNRTDYGFIPMKQADFNSLMRQDNMIHLEDIKKGFVPNPDEPYGVFFKPGSDSVNISPSGQLDYDSFMKDDVVSARIGNEELKAVLGKILFKDEKISTVGNYHRVTDFNDLGARGLLLDDVSNGIISYDYVDFIGRFVWGSTGGAEALKNRNLERIIMKTDAPEISINETTYLKHGNLYLPLLSK